MSKMRRIPWYRLKMRNCPFCGNHRARVVREKYGSYESAYATCCGVGNCGARTASYSVSTLDGKFDWNASAILAVQHWNNRPKRPTIFDLIRRKFNV